VKKKAKRNQKASPLALDIRLYTAKIGRSNRLEPILLSEISCMRVDFDIIITPGVRGLFNRNSLAKRRAEAASLHLYRVRTQRIEKK
jgi:hypothetical protein